MKADKAALASALKMREDGIPFAQACQDRETMDLRSIVRHASAVIAERDAVDEALKVLAAYMTKHGTDLIARKVMNHYGDAMSEDESSVETFIKIEAMERKKL